jgi:aarF domain-containing kinase
MLDFVKAFPTGDMSGVGAALSGMGFTKELDEVTAAAFATDLQEVFDSILSMPPADLANGAVDETQLNRAVSAVAKVADGYGIRFPREFALLIKQVLYFDRYTRLLAPGLDVLSDERLSMNRPPPTTTAEAEAEAVVVLDAEVLPPESLPGAS